MEKMSLDSAEKQAFLADYALMGAQRAAKILGIFVRLSRRDGKPGYLKHLPRVRAALARNLEHPALAPVRRWFAGNLPEILTRPKIKTAMILAAGLGTRMKHLTANAPKPLVEVNGMALIDHVLARLEGAGIDHIVVNLHYKADQLQHHLEQKNLPYLAFSDERKILLDTGGGVKAALPKLGPGAFFILNTDSLWLEGRDSNLAELEKMWSDQDMDFLLLLASSHGSLGYDGPGDFHLLPDGRLRRRGPGEAAEFAHTGICIARHEAFANSPSSAFSLNLLWDRALAKNRLFGLPLRGEWMHVGAPNSVAQAARRLQEAGK
jgi:MurNAc alpha-1-phosphate uridylyltransferase